MIRNGCAREPPSNRRARFLRKPESGDFTRVKICGRDLFDEPGESNGESKAGSVAAPALATWALVATAPRPGFEFDRASLDTSNHGDEGSRRSSRSSHLRIR